MNCKYLICVLSIFTLMYEVKAQNNFSSYQAHTSVQQAIGVTSDIIKGRTLFFEKQAEKKPLMFVKTKKSISDLNRIANSISRSIDSVQKVVNPERILLGLLDDNHYQNIFFDENGDLTIFGIELQDKVSALYKVNKKINVHKLTHLDDFMEKHFKVDNEYYNEEGDQIDYFHYMLHDKSNYGIMLSMNLLLLDVKTYQLLYYGTVMNY